MLTPCELCPRRCGADREHGKTGFCRAGRKTEIFRYGPHHGEEPPISGSNGSGTVFFSRCTMACLYCQNHPWSQQGEGDTYDTDQLCHALKALAAHGCHNWNIVSPTPWMPHIRTALHQAGAAGYRLPVVYNTSGYERLETLQEFADEIQIYLTDLRYSKPTTAAAASAAVDYTEHARRALRSMWQRIGPLRYDENEVALSGVICRILILPGHADEAVENLQWLAAELGTDVPVSVMAQYRPAYQALEQAPWCRRVSREEYRQVCAAVESLDFETGWIQMLEEDVEDGLLGHRMPRGGFDRK